MIMVVVLVITEVDLMTIELDLMIMVAASEIIVEDLMIMVVALAIIEVDLTIMVVESMREVEESWIDADLIMVVELKN